MVNLLKEVHRTVDREVDSVLLCYKCHQKVYSDLKKSMPNLILFEGVPNEDQLNQWMNAYDCKIMIFDDQLGTIEKREYREYYTDLVRVYAHHKNLSVWFLVQNLYTAKTDTLRVITNQTFYTFLFTMPRGMTSLAILGKQILRGGNETFFKIYQKVSREPYSPLIVNTHPAVANKGLLLSSGFLKNQQYTVYNSAC